MKRIVIAGVSAGAVLLLAACGSTNHNAHTSGSASSSTMSGMSGMNMGSGTPGSAAPKLGTSAGVSTQHNDADGVFANEMIPHHSQAIDMANKEFIDGQNAKVKALAKKIMAAQSPEITTMNAWLAAWGISPAGHQGHGSMSMPGMMSDADMAKFRSLKGSSLDRSFLDLMIRHHEGALVMGKTELAGGSNPHAKALAQAIIDSQTAEIDTMKKLLATLPS